MHGYEYHYKCRYLLVINPMKHNPSSAAESHSTSHLIHCLLWNPKIHCHIQKSVNDPFFGSLKLSNRSQVSKQSLPFCLPINTLHHFSLEARQCSWYSDQARFQSQKQQEIFSSPKMEPTQHPIEGVLGFFPRPKWPGHKVNHSPPFSANIQNTGAIHILPLYACMAWTWYLYLSYHFLMSSYMLHALPTSYPLICSASQ